MCVESYVVMSTVYRIVCASGLFFLLALKGHGGVSGEGGKRLLSAGGDRAKRDGGGGGDRGRVFEREVDLDWISKPLGDIYEGYYDDRAADAKGLDPLQAELRTKGLGARRKGGGR